MTRPNRKLQILAILGILLLIVLVCLNVPGGGEGRKSAPTLTPPPKPPAPPPALETHGDLAELPLKFHNGVAVLGDPAAKVKVEAFIPGHQGCGNETAKVLCDLQAANPDKLRLVVVNFDDRGGAAYQEKTGTSCAGLLINGKQEMEIPGPHGGKPLKIVFKDNLGDRYSVEDLQAALNQAFLKAYGEKLNTKPKPPTPKSLGKEAKEMAQHSGNEP
ncbi:MAG: hypothetical protein ACUVX8_04820 [Candidatus Zipacnadales bacterium]